MSRTSASGSINTCENLTGSCADGLDIKRISAQLPGLEVCFLGGLRSEHEDTYQGQVRGTSVSGSISTCEKLTGSCAARTDTENPSADIGVCPNNHPLRRRVAKNHNYCEDCDVEIRHCTCEVRKGAWLPSIAECDSCGVEFTEGQCTYRCRKCVWVLCTGCEEEWSEQN